MQTPWGDCAAVDAHIHFFSRPFFEVLASEAGKSVEAIAAELGWELPPADPAELARRWAAELDRQGVRRAAMIASVPGDANSVRAARAACPKLIPPSFGGTARFVQTVKLSCPNNDFKSSSNRRF